MSLLKAHNKWPLKKLSHDWKAISDGVVFKKKIGIDRKAIRYKVRWVVRSFKPQYGLDYKQTFAFMAKSMSYKINFL